VSSLEEKIGETEKRYEEANKISEERLKQTLDAESKIIQLKTAMQRYCSGSNLLWYLYLNYYYFQSLNSHHPWPLFAIIRFCTSMTIFLF